MRYGRTRSDAVNVQQARKLIPSMGAVSGFTTRWMGSSIMSPCRERYHERPKSRVMSWLYLRMKSAVSTWAWVFPMLVCVTP
jgi:hypothetical protein